jgi:hypothetical protein
MLLTRLPPVVSGAAITYDLAVVTPIARANIVLNPSVETATTGYTGIGAGGISRVTTYAAHGAYSLAVTPAGAATDGVYYGTVSLTAGTTYAASVDFYAPTGIGKLYRLSFATTAGALLQSVEFRATGRWQRVSVLWTETSTTTRRIYVTNAAAQTPVFYIDGLQVEACETGNYWPTTYIDGDQQGLVPNESPPAYLWTGTPHASTSARSGQTRAGGRVRRFRDFGFTPSALIGLGLDTPEHDLVPFSVLDGAQYNDTRKPPRPFSLVGRFDGLGSVALARNRGGLARLLDRDLIARRQPLTLQITPQDACGKAIGKTGTLTALYAGGLEGNHTNPFAEEAAISFTTVQQSTIQGTDAGSALTPTANLTLDYVIQRATTGAWARVGAGTNFNGAVRALARGPDGRLYAAGDFTSAAGGVAANRIAYYDGSAWNAMGTGANGIVRALAVGPDGSIYAAGDFTAMGGVANTSRIAYWDGSAWNAMSTGAAANEIYALTVGQDGSIYAGGTFTTIGGTAANRIARWNGSAWSAMGTGAGATVRALTTMLDGSIVAGGDFTTMGGVTGADRVARWTASAWVAMSTGAGGNVHALAVDPRGTLYAGGAFTTIGGVSANRIASWNGAQWSALAGGVDNTVSALAVDPLTNTLYAGGVFETTDSVITLSHLAIWSGSTWVAPDTENATDNILALLVQPSGALVVGMDAITGSPWIVAGQTSLTNNGTAVTYPRVLLLGPSAAATTGTARTLINIDTGARISFDLDISTNERVTIDLEPSAIQIVSNIRGLITGTILEGSDTTNFGLQPGTNTISLLAGNGITAVAWWPERYLAADHLIPVRS